MVDRRSSDDAPPASALRQALSPACARRSLGVTLVVGTLLNAINQGDLLLTGGDVSYVKLALTYLVPFCVSTYGAFSMARISARRQPKDWEADGVARG